MVHALAPTAARAWRRTSHLCRQVQGCSPVRPVATQAEQGPLTRLEVGGGGVAKITLCRPKKLNSLSMPMIRELADHYAQLQKSSAKCVILAGEGRALCAGGDVAEIREGILEGNTSPADFFYEEYALDYGIATLQERSGIVQVALWDGIVMGGGVGLSAHSPIRIATEKTMLAMPETLIGLFPDVGMTWALSRLKAGSHVGLYLGLVGARLGAADCLASGLATHFCPSDRLPQLEERLRALGDSKVGCAENVSAVIREVAGDAAPDGAKAMLEKNAAALERCFGAGVDSAEEVTSRLEKETCDWSKDALKNLRLRSPISVKISMEAMKRHQSCGLKEAMTAEYRLAQWCMRTQPQSDFCEGIRAVLVDKDNKPSWQPPTLEEVPRERVEEFFAPLPAGHPRGELQL